VAFRSYLFLLLTPDKKEFPRYMLQQQKTPQEILTEEEAAKYLRVDQRTLRRWRGTHTGPECSKIGGKLIRYKRTKIDEWLDLQTLPSAPAQ
jgi:excisionase family DNA binding protein